MQTPQYNIYNASAGSGKTFTLVKSFLKIILNSNDTNSFRNLLAITFTNKAVNEMKERIIETLMLFSDFERAKTDAMFSQISEELKISPEKLSIKSLKILKEILHNYAALTIATIDGFNHRLIRSFAFDLNLNPNFEVFMDTEELLDKAIDNLLQKTGKNEKITEFLLNFSEYKISEDKNWDITQELYSVAKLLTIENNYQFIKDIEQKNIEDFEILTNELKDKQQKEANNIKKQTEKFFNISQKGNLDKNSFNGGHLYNFFEKLKNNSKTDDVIKSFDSKWALNCFSDSPENLYSKTLEKTKPEIASFLDEHSGEICNILKEVKKSIFYEKFYKKIIQNIIPLAILNTISQEIKKIKEEDNILPISEFNNIIHETIKNQPTPFIYEKIGQRYKHFFIDEFQDTSTLQWQNISPLIADALHSENHSGIKGSLLLVGDAKQSIYRWRGGKTEQFIDLYEGKKKPFYPELHLFDLDKNFRSSQKIIEFNNDFFNFISKEKLLFTSDLYKNLYKKAQQNTHPKTPNEGFVSIEFIDTKNIEEDKNKDILYCESVKNSVENALKSGFSLRDICVLTRTNKQGIILAQYLTEHKYEVISPDALLLNNILEIRFLIDLIKISLSPDNKEIKSSLLLLYAQINQLKNIDNFLIKYINLPINDFFNLVNFSMEFFHQYSFYEGIAYAIEKFNLAKDSDAYLSHFLDVIFEFKNTKKGGISDFLTFWENKKDKISISAPNGLNAINVMTIHKSKGLEFPVVIYSYVNDKLNDNKDKVWLKVNPKIFNGFNYLLIDEYKGLENIDPEFVSLQKEQNLLDQINVMYVAMTRPRTHLYIISEYKAPNKNSEEIKNFSDIIIHFLKNKNFWEDNKYLYTFGEPVQRLGQKEEKNDKSVYFAKISEKSNYKIVTKSGLLWDNKKQNAIEKGNIIHSLLAKIKFSEDIPQALQSAKNEGVISENQSEIIKKQLLKIVNHSELFDYFTQKYKVFNETDFLNKNAEFERPDRVVISENNEAIIIDYKTGIFLPKYEIQIKKYAKTISDLGYKVSKLYLVFIKDEIEIMTF